MPWLPVVVTSAPSAEPLSLVEAKAQCRVTDTSEDTLITSFIQAAREYVERYTGTKLITQTVEMRASSFGDLGHLAAAPVQSISSITYLDVNGVRQTLSPSVYEAVLTGLEPEVRTQFAQTWPQVRCASDAVLVTAIVGYGNAAAVPQPIKQAMLLLVGDWNEHREDTIAERSVVPATMPNGVDQLLANYRAF